MYSIQKKFLCLILCLAMVFTALPIGVFAEDKNSEVETSAIEQIAEEVEEEKQEEEAPEISAEDSEEEKEVTEEVPEEIEEAEEEETPIETVDEEEKETPTEEVEEEETEDEKETPTEEETEEVETPAEEEEVEEETPAEDETEEELPKEDEEEKEQPEETEDEKVEEEIEGAPTEEVNEEETAKKGKLDDLPIDAKSYSYSVKHYKQKIAKYKSINDADILTHLNYELADTDNLTVSSYGGKTAASAKSYEGFTCEGVNQKNVYLNGASVEIYYTRDIVKVNYQTDENGTKTNDDVYYGATISLSLDGGSIAGNISSYNIGTTNNVIPNPTKTGFKFTGWKKDDSNSVGNFTLTAQWKPLLTLTYNANGGTGDKTEEYYADTTVTLADGTGFTKDGYYFGGWSTTTDGEPVSSVTMGSTNKTVYAIWYKSNVKVTYKGYGSDSGSVTLASSTTLSFGGEGISKADVSMKDRKSDVTIDDPSRSGYKFEGWSYNQEQTKLVANWSLVWYTISYDLNGEGATNNNENPAQYTITSATITLKSPSRTGYTFAGWYSGSKKVESIASGSTENKSFTAKWTANKHTITLDANGGHVRDGVALKTVQLAGGYSVNGNKIEYSLAYDDNYGALLSMIGSDENRESFSVGRTGYYFTGWYLDENTKVYSDTKYKVDSDVTLKAGWEKSTYEVKFDGNGADSGSMETQEYERNTEYNLPANTFVKEGYDFNGWFGSNLKTYSDKEKVKKMTLLDSVTLTAQWKIQTKTFTYNGTDQKTFDYWTELTVDPNGGTYSGSAISFTMVVKDNYTFGTPERTDYTFRGWEYSNKTFKAKWTPDNCKFTFLLKTSDTTTSKEAIILPYDTQISFVLNDGNYKYSTYKLATELTEFDNPTRDYYTFKGWTWNGGSNTLTANWTPIEYTISYDLNGSGVNFTGYLSTYTVESDDITLVSPTRAGYEFLGWTDENKLLDLSPEIGLKIAKGSYGNQSFKAHWSGKKYTVTLDANEGVMKDAYGGGSTYSYQVTYDTVYGIPVSTLEAGSFASSSAKRDEFTFDGWYTTKEGGTRIYADTTFKQVANQTLYAHWVQHTYTVKFNGNGADGVTSMSDQVISRSALVNLKANEFTRAGYDFAGWSYDNDGLVIFVDKGTVFDIASANGSITLYAKWTPKVYNVKLKSNTGTFVSNDTTEDVYVVYGKTFGDAYCTAYPLLKGIEEFEERVAKIGYTFNGWYANEAGTGTEYDDDSSVTSTPPTHLYATWSAITYSVTLDPGLGEGTSTGLGTKTYDVEFQLGDAPKDYKLVGYHFNGWSTTKTGALGVHYSATENVKNLAIIEGSNVTLYAQWAPNTDTKYTVKYYVQDIDGEFPSTATYTCAGAGTTLELTNPKSLKKDTLSNAGITSDFNESFFTEVGFDNLPIAGDGSTVVKLYYTRNICKVNYDIIPLATSFSGDIRYGATVTLDINTPSGQTLNYAYATSYVVKQNSVSINSPSLSGYTFLGWLKTPALALGDYKLTAQWQINQYDITWLDNKDATTASAIGATKHAIDFGTAIVINPNDGIFSGDQLNITVATKSIKIQDPTRVGYEFIGWKRVDFEIGKGFTLTAQWKALNVGYTIKHFKQDIASESALNTNFTLVKTEEVDGFTGNTTTAKAMDYTGFTAAPFIQEIIKGDGSTVINIYYARNLYAITYRNALGVVLPDNVYYEGEITLLGTTAGGFTESFTVSAIKTISDPTDDYYNFVGWEKTPTGCEGNFTLKSKWIPKEAGYEVWHLQQNLAQSAELNLLNYSCVEKDCLTGRAIDFTKATVRDTKTYTTFAGFTAVTPIQQLIKPDGTTVIYVFYTRDTKQVTYTNALGVKAPDTVYYGATISLALQGGSIKDGITKYAVGVKGLNDTTSFEILNPTRAAHRFVGWTKDPIGAEGNFTLYAEWHEEHTVTVSNAGIFAGGIATASAAYALDEVCVGDIIKVDVTREIGYVVKDLYYTDAQGKGHYPIPKVLGQNEFVMPDFDVQIVAVFEAPQKVDYTLELTSAGKAHMISSFKESLLDSANVKYIKEKTSIGGVEYSGYWQLSGASFRTSNTVAILVTGDVLVKLVGENNFFAGNSVCELLDPLIPHYSQYSYGIFAGNNNLTFYGDGSIGVYALVAEKVSEGIHAGKLAIYDATVTAEARATVDTFESFGVHTVFGIVQNGVLSAKGFKAAISCETNGISVPKHTGIQGSKYLHGELERGYLSESTKTVIVKETIEEQEQNIVAKRAYIYPKQEVTYAGIKTVDGRFHGYPQSGLNSVDEWRFTLVSPADGVENKPFTLSGIDFAYKYYQYVEDVESPGSFKLVPTTSSACGAKTEYGAPVKQGSYHVEVYVSIDNLYYYGTWSGDFSVGDPLKRKEDTSVPVSGSDDTVDISIKQNGDNAVLNDIRPKDLEEVGTDDVVVVDLSQLLNPVHELQISDLTIQNIIDSDAKGLEIRLKEAIITFDHDALETIKSQMGGLGMTLTVNTEKPAEKTLSDSQKETLKEKPKALVIDAFIVSHGVRIKNFNGNAKVSIKVPDEMVGQTIKVYYLDEQGVLENMAATFTYVDKDQYATFVTTHFSHYILEGDGLPFVDVLAPDYFYDPVVWAFQNGIVKGDDETHFLPNGFTTRAQMVTFLWRVAGCPEVEYDMPFTDVPEDEYYAPAVRWGVAMGYVKGTEETLFSPEEAVTRGQTVTFLARYSGINDDSTEYNHAFIDVPATEYYNTAVAWAATNNITLGTTELQFEPESKCLRSEIVTFLWRLFAKKEEK